MALAHPEVEACSTGACSSPSPHLLGTLDPAEASEHVALSRASLLIAVAIAVHDFPEGIATFVGAMHDPAVGGSVAWPLPATGRTIEWSQVVVVQPESTPQE